MTRTDPIIAVKLAEERAAWKLRAEIAEDALQRVREIHTPTSHGHFDLCSCGRTWPCGTIRAIEGTK